MISSALHLALFRGHSIRWLWSPYLFVGDVFRKHNRLLAPIFRRKFTEHTFFFFSLKASEAYFLYIYFTPIKLCHLHSHSSSETTWVSPESSSMSSLKLNNFPLSLSLSTEVVQFPHASIIKRCLFLSVGVWLQRELCLFRGLFWRWRESSDSSFSNNEPIGLINKYEILRWW